VIPVLLMLALLIVLKAVSIWSGTEPAGQRAGAVRW